MLRRLLASTSKLPAPSLLSSSSSPSSLLTPLRLVHTSSVHLAKAATVAPAAASPPPIPLPRPDVATPSQFLKAISTPPLRDLSAETGLTALLGEGEGEWDKLWILNGKSLRKAGLPIKNRRYLLWAMDKFRQGLDPAKFKIRPKKKKVVRGWGPRVQNGYRRIGRLRPGEKRPPSNVWTKKDDREYLATLEKA